MITTVETVEPMLSGSEKLASLKSPMKKIVAIEDSEMFTILLPTNTLVKNLSYLLSIFVTSVARLLPPCARFFILILLNDVNAVSVEEKNPENTSNTIIAATKPISLGPKLANSGKILVGAGSILNKVLSKIIVMIISYKYCYVKMFYFLLK